MRNIDSGAEQYTYDAHGHWAKRLVGTTTTYFFYTRAGQLIGEYTAAPGTGWREPVYLDGTQIAALENAVLINPAIAVDVATGKALEAVTNERLTHDKLAQKNKNPLLTGTSTTTNPLDPKSKRVKQTEEPLFYDGFATADLSAWNWVEPGHPGQNRLEVNQQAALGEAGSGEECQAGSGSRCGLVIRLEEAIKPAESQAVTVGLAPGTLLANESALRGRFWLDPGLLDLSTVADENRLLIMELSHSSDPPDSRGKLQFYLERRDWEGYWMRVEHWDEDSQMRLESGSGYLVADRAKPAPVWLEWRWQAEEGEFGLYALDPSGIRQEPPIVERNDLNTHGQTIDSLQFGAVSPPLPGTQGNLYLDEVELRREETP